MKGIISRSDEKAAVTPNEARMSIQVQSTLFANDVAQREVPDEASSTFIGNMSLPIHRWFRYSAGFSAEWVMSVIRDAKCCGDVRVFDPFAGSATTLLAAEAMGVESWGIDAHPFVSRVARAKLAWRSDPDAYLEKTKQLRIVAAQMPPGIEDYPVLIHKCYDEESLRQLDALRRAYEAIKDDTPASDLLWLTLVGILRRASNVGTAPWQYVLPRKQKVVTTSVARALDDCCTMIYTDMLQAQSERGPAPHFLQSDARTCEGVPRGFATLVITSPPYPNNYDYADATRLEMSFMREIDGWRDLQAAVRSHLIRSCSQHVPLKDIDLGSVLQTPELEPIREEIAEVCAQLGEIRKSKGGKKTYHLMVACYFRDLALTWKALREVCASPSRACFVIGDSAPYGVYVPVIPWLGRLAVAAGFHSYSFERTRDRNVKWKNRKHRVPLQEGRLWVEG